MDPVLLLFGSQSDAPVYERIIARLHADGIPHHMKVCSAHRAPNVLQDILRTESYSMVIAGAGLAAHLPGVVASSTIRPVIGVPVNANFDGADSMLSIIQMPPKVPVLAVGVNQAEEAGRYAAKMMRPPREIVLITNGLLLDRFEESKSWLDKGGFNYAFSDEQIPDRVNVMAFPLDQEPPVVDDVLTIFVPVSSSPRSSDIPSLLDNTKKGMFVGVNRVENGIIAAAQIMSMEGAYDDYLGQSRKDLEESIRRQL